MTKIHVICVAYDRDISLRILIDSFIVQTYPNWVLYVIYDGEIPIKVQKIRDSYMDYRIKFINTDTRNGNYGHPNRKYCLELLPENNDFVLMTNDDNYYTPKFLEYMVKEVNGEIGMIYCDTVHSHYLYNVHTSCLKEQCIDMGAFMVRLDIAKKTGFNHVHFSADGKYAEECKKACVDANLRTIHVPKPIFVHN